MENVVIVLGWALLVFLFSSLFGAGFIVGEPLTSKRPRLHIALGSCLLLGLPAIGLMSLWLSPDVFFPNAWYPFASAGTVMGVLVVGSTA